MAVYDRWHKSRPAPGDPLCSEHGKASTAAHGKGDRWQVRWRDDTGRQCRANFSSGPQRKLTMPGSGLASPSALIGRTPCDGIRLPALPRREVWIPELPAVDAIAGHLPRWYRAVPLVAASTGLRPSELLGLEVECIDFLRRTIRVRQQVITSPAAGNTAYLAPPKTPQSERTVPVTQATVDLLAAHLAEFPATGVEVEDRVNPRKPVRRPGRLMFTTSRGEPVKRSAWSGVWEPAARKAGFPPRTGLHACRHLYASALIRFSESVKTVQHLMGHPSPTVTLNVYGHLWPDADDRARQAIDAAFGDVPSACPQAGEA